MKLFRPRKAATESESTFTSTVLSKLSDYGLDCRSIGTFLYAIGSIIFLIMPWIALYAAVKGDIDLYLSSKTINIIIITLTMGALAKYARAVDEQESLDSSSQVSSNNR